MLLFESVGSNTYGAAIGQRDMKQTIVYLEQGDYTKRLLSTDNTMYCEWQQSLLFHK